VIESPDTRRGRSEGSGDGRGNGDSASPDETAGRVDPDDELIDEVVEESFPASDSPSSWAGPPSESH